MQNFDEWNEVKKQTDKKLSTVILREGSIYWCKFGLNIGNETRGKGKCFRRPVLILRKFTKDVFFGIPLTSQEKHGDWYYKIKNKTQTNYLILNQLKLIDRKRLEEKIYQISEKELLEIKKVFCILILKNTKARF